MKKVSHLIKKNPFLIGLVIIMSLKMSFLIINSINLANQKNLSQEEVEQEEKIKQKEEQNPINKVYVDIKGAVVNPGLYEVESTLRVGEVIEVAGGFSHANTQCVNLSKKISDEEIIFIPDKSQMCQSGEKNSQNNYGSNNEESELDGSTLININNATESELMSLNGIGETRASDIVKYREENGSFIKVEDIKDVKGIGDVTYENIKGEITV